MDASVVQTMVSEKCRDTKTEPRRLFHSNMAKASDATGVVGKDISETA